MNARRRALLLGLVLLGCGGGVIQRVDALPPAPPGQGFVEISCEPADAEVYVDGRFFGRLDGYAQGVVRLPEGRRRLSLRKPGHYPWHGEVDVGPTPARVQTRLVPEVPP